MAKKAPDKVDAHIGSRIRGRRLSLGMSQEKLAAALSLSFQQVQKYEKGANRVGGSRMQQIATVLKVPVAWFYDGQPGTTAALYGADDFITKFLSDRDGIAFARAWMKIENYALQRALVRMAEAAHLRLCAMRRALRDEGMPATAELLNEPITELDRALKATCGATA